LPLSLIISREKESILPSAEVSKRDLFKACESLFGTDIDVSVEFLRYLKPAGVKAAFRRKALETHPDRAIMLASQADSLENRFKEINLAYQLLKKFLNCPWKYQLDEEGVIFRRKKRPVSPARKSAQDVIRETKYSGRIPQRKLLLGQYLYYSGHIALTTLIKAVVWQRLQRPSIGSIAAQRDWIDQENIYDILRNRRRGEKFGECALRRGYISRYQLMMLLNRQRILQPQIGQYFIEAKILSRHKMYGLIDELKGHNREFWFL
jgi:hypothetical protein